MNYRLLTTQFGESMKYHTSVNEIDRLFQALTEIEFVNYPNASISSVRSQLIYSWVLTIRNSSLNEDDKINLLKVAIQQLVPDTDLQDKLLSLCGNTELLKVMSKSYVHQSRLNELKSINNIDFDLIKLIRYCEELNIAYENNMLFAVAMLVRGIIDHVPPIFQRNTFMEVVNNYGSKSFKDSMKNLGNSLRKIADSYLHTHIRRKEVLPTTNQVDFSNDLDVLLGEIIRILK